MSAVGDKIINYIANTPTHDGANWDGWCESKEYRESAAFGNAPSVAPADARAAYEQAHAAGNIRTDLSWDAVPDGWFVYFPTTGPHWHLADKANGLLTMASQFCTTQIHPSLGWCANPDEYIARAKSAGARFLGYSRTLGADGVILGSAITPAGGGGVTPISNTTGTEHDMTNATLYHEVTTQGAQAYLAQLPNSIQVISSDWAAAIAKSQGMDFSKIPIINENDLVAITATLAADQAVLKTDVSQITLTDAQIAQIGGSVHVDLSSLTTAIAALDTQADNYQAQLLATLAKGLVITGTATPAK